MPILRMTASELPGWQVAGLTLAVVCLVSTAGLGALLAAAAFAPVMYALVRLRRHAPDAPSTAALVRAASGGSTGLFAGTLQVLGYGLLSIALAQQLGPTAVHWLALVGFDDEGSWTGPVAAASVLVAAALLVLVLPARLVVAVTGLLALTGVLVYLGVALTLIHRYSGPRPLGAPNLSVYDPVSDFAMFAELAGLALTAVGFEIVTAQVRRARSIGRPMGLALAGAALVAVVAWYATHLAGSAKSSSADIATLVDELHDVEGRTWLQLSFATMVTAGLLALTWGARGVLSHTGAGLAAFGAYVVAAAVVTIGLYLWEVPSGDVGALVLLVFYLVILAASWSIPGEDAVTWWPRILTLLAIMALFLVPPEFATRAGALQAVGVALVLVVLSGIVGLVGTRGRPG